MPTETTVPRLEEHLEGLHRLHRGKVRDIFPLDDHHLLIVATDRVSAFDVVLPQRIPDKGRVLTSLSLFWFEKLKDIVANHLVESDVRKMPEAVTAHAGLLAGRSMLVHRAKPLPAEFIVRGYLAGSGFKEYTKTGAICGHELPSGLRLGDKLPEPILTPSTKAPQGEHDENITIPQLAHLVGPGVASKAGALALALYEEAADHAESCGFLLADTKLEFGIHAGDIMLIDEVFTPDSSRFWSKATHEPGKALDSFDKQIVRDHLEGTGWDKNPPPPELPDDVVGKTRERYLEIHKALTGRDLG